MSQEEHNLIEVIEFCRTNRLPADVVGRWVWLRFTEKPADEVRELIKDYGFRWVRLRNAWAHNCGHWSKRGHQDPRFKYGAVPVDQVDTAGLRVSA